jgi:esterase/lipase
MRKFWGYLPYLVGLLALLYFLGPKPSPPNLDIINNYNLPSQLPSLEAKLTSKETLLEGLKPNNQARIVWADSSQKQQTELAIVYIHGFSASQEEGNPVHRQLAKRYGANLYLARLAGHGIDLGPATMKNLSANDMLQSAQEALAIGRLLGKKVIVVATSFGAALSLQLASKNKDIAALVLYSPCIEVFDKNAKILDNPWGFQLAKLINGSEWTNIKAENKDHDQYWSLRYHLSAVVALQNFLTHAMVPATFARVSCPTFLGYYYKNQNEQDPVVSVAALLKMYDALGSTQKQKVAFSNTGNHVLTSPVLSKDVATVQAATFKFLDTIFTPKLQATAKEYVTTK